MIKVDLFLSRKSYFRLLLRW